MLVPAFSVLATDDDWNTSPEVEAVIPLVKHIVQKYGADTDRIYTTGQSMGCMMSLYLFEKGTVLSEIERFDHNASFNSAYKIDALLKNSFLCTIVLTEGAYGQKRVNCLHSQGENL